MQENEVYGEIGAEGFSRLVAAFYRRVPHDDILGPMYRAGGLEGAEGRLRDFLIYRFGGPATYIEERGHPRLRMRHAPFSIGTAARDRWMELMTAALVEAQLPPAVNDLLRSFFDGTATFLINRSPHQEAALQGR